MAATSLYAFTLLKIKSLPLAIPNFQQMSIYLCGAGFPYKCGEINCYLGLTRVCSLEEKRLPRYSDVEIDQTNHSVQSDAHFLLCIYVLEAN